MAQEGTVSSCSDSESKVSAEWAVPSQTLALRLVWTSHTRTDLAMSLVEEEAGCCPFRAWGQTGDRRGTRLGNTARARTGQEALGLRAPFPGKVLFSTRADTLTISIKGLLSIFNKKRSCLKQKYHNNYSIYFLSTTQHGLPQTVLQKCTQMVPAQELTLAMCVVASCSPKFQRPEINTQVQTHSCDNAKQLRAAPKQPP